MTEWVTNPTAKKSISPEKKGVFSYISPISKNFQVIFLFLLVSVVPFTSFFTPHVKKNTSAIRTQKTTNSVNFIEKTSVLDVNPSPIKTVFVVVMENTSWRDILGTSSAQYINRLLLPRASYASNYSTPTHNHPSEPNYIWMETGSSMGITNDDSPLVNHQVTNKHLTALLDTNGTLWKSYQEDISGSECPLTDSGLYAPKHNPMVYFDDVTDSNNSSSVGCMIHIRPFNEFSMDLKQDAIGRYNFITPNLCNDMHNQSGCKYSDRIKNGDIWLSENVPQIFRSRAYKDGGALFITWDEGTNDSDGPVGMMVFSSYAKGNGFTNHIAYTHSSLLKTIQEIFNVQPMLGDAENAKDFRDLFISVPVTPKPSEALAQNFTISPTSTPTAISTPTTSPVMPTDTPVSVQHAANSTIPVTTDWMDYKSGSETQGFSFTYPAEWKVTYRQNTSGVFIPLEFFITGNSDNTSLSIDIYSKAGSVQEFITTYFPQFKNELSITANGKIGDKTLYKIAPKTDIAENNLVNFEFGTHGIIMGSDHIYDIGFTGGSRSAIDAAEKNLWPNFHFR